MKYLHLLIVVISLLFFSGCQKHDGTPKTNTKPNIIFIMADDLGWAEIGAYGQRQIPTPNIDALARDGIKLTDFYSGSTVCAPSRHVLLTGKHTGTTGRHRNSGKPMPDADFTFAESLQTQGYTTAMYGKWGLGEVGSEGQPDKQGFDEWLGFTSHQRAHYHYPKWLWHNGEKIEYSNNDISNGNQYAHNIFIDNALNYLDDYVTSNTEKPFLLYLPITLPHADIIVPEIELKKFKGQFKEVPFEGGHYNAQSHPNAATAAMITMIDESVGSIRKKIAEYGLDRNTIIIFTSDNGPVSVGGRDPNFFNATGPLKGFKRDLYEGGIRVPFIAYWPDTIPAGAESNLPASFSDIMPTLQDIGQGTISHEVDGISIFPTLKGNTQSPKNRVLYWSFEGRKLNGSVSDRSKWGPKYFVEALRSQDYKLLRYNRNKTELYNLRTDVGETTDLSDSMPELVSELSARMDMEFMDKK